MISFRTFNFWNVEAKAWESTMPSEQQLKRELGCGKMFKSIIGGLAISYLDKAESGIDYDVDDLVFSKLKKQRSKVRRLRIIWFFWMVVSFYLVLVPFTAEIASIPMVGGLLLALEHQTATMLIFGVVLTFEHFALLTAILWYSYKPWVSLISLVCFTVVMVLMFKTGESLPTEYAKFKLGYF